MIPLTDKRVDTAFFDKNKPKAYFVTLDKELYAVDLVNNSSTILKEKVLDPSLSADGKYMVYAKLNSDWKEGQYYDKALGLAVLNLETGEEKLITHSSKDFDASWSPDSSRIIFMSDAYVQDTPTTTQKVSLKGYVRVPSGAFHPAKPEFAEKQIGDAMPQPVNADGTLREEFTTIIIPSTYSNHTTFFSIKPDGSERTQLTTSDELKDKTRKPPVPSSELSWSKDGTSFVYDSDGNVWTGSMGKDLKKIIAKKIGAGRNPKWAKDTGIITAIPANTDKGIIKIL